MASCGAEGEASEEPLASLCSLLMGGGEDSLAVSRGSAVGSDRRQKPAILFSGVIHSRKRSSVVAVW